MQHGKGAFPEREAVPSGLTSAPLLSEDWLRPLLDETPVPVLVIDRHQRLVFVNQAAAQLFGSGLRLGESLSLGDGDAWQVWVNRALTQKESFGDLPFMVEDRAGIALPLLVSLSPIRRDHEAPCGCLVVCREGRMDYLARRAIQIQEATLNSILENFPTPFFMVDPDLVVTHMNRRMATLSGYRREEAVGRITCGAMLNTAQCDTEDCVLRMVMQKKSPVSGLRRVIRDRQGREIHVVVHASLITDPAGQVIGGFEAVRDITPVVEAEKQVELLSELSQEGILMLDEDQCIIFANSRMAEITEQSREELIGQNIGVILSPQHQRSAAELARLSREGHQWDVEFCSTLEPSRTSGGERRVFETSMAGTQVGDKIITYVYLRDLSYRVKIGRELHKTINFLNNIIQASVDGIVVVDRKGVPLMFNEGAERILGYKAEEVIGHPEVFRQFYPLEVATEMMRRMRSDQYGPKDKLNTTQITFIHKNGEEVPVLFSAAIIREHNREVGSVGIFSDLREYLKLRQDLEESQTQLVQAQKIASLGRLASGVAHEINNPLAGILIYSELFQQQLPEGTPGREYLEEIIAQTLRCQQIVQRLLEFSRQSLGQKVLFDINQIINRCVDLVSHQAIFLNVTFHRRLDPDLPQMEGDPGQLQQVFTNLLLNAADAMAGRGSITITSQADDQGVILTFADTGCGIPPEVRDKVFEPFFTTKAPGQGTGLGLAIVYGVIQRHGGTIEVDSSVGGGTTFTVRLPLKSPPSEIVSDFV